MTTYFPCPYLGDDVELTEERIQHIAETHPGILPDYQAQVAETLADPDQIRRSQRSQQALLFSRWFTTIRTGRYMVVVVVSDSEPSRHWIVTAYTDRKLVTGDVIWQKS